MVITSAVHEKLRIGVFMGGKSIEREVSFNSGRTVCDHLDSSTYTIVPIFQTEEGDLYILPWHFLHRGKIADFRHRLAAEAQHITWDTIADLVDYMYIAAHGRYGEDGVLQGMLEVLGIPYLGSKVFASALGMDKAFHKQLLAGAGIAVPRGFVIRSARIVELSESMLDDEFIAAGLTFPCIVKPSHEGSSLGLTVVHNRTQLLAAIRYAANIDTHCVQDVIVEEKINGMEFVCVSLENPLVALSDQDRWYSLPITEVIPEAGMDFFDYEQKYMPGRATKRTPAHCTPERAQEIKKVCEHAARVLQFTTMSRIDGIVDQDGRVVIIDPNTLTGMGPTTFLFHQAAHFGLTHGQLINMLITNDLIAYGLLSSNDHVLSNNGKKTMHNKMRIGVLLGGDSNEREISLESGRNVCYKLASARYDVTPLFVDDAMHLFVLPPVLLIKNSAREIAAAVDASMRIRWNDLPQNFDFIFIGLHGGKGEDGSVQGALEMLGLPYNGPGVLASALCMDKYKTNAFLAAQGFNVPQSMLIEKAQWDVMTTAERESLITPLLTASNNVVVKPHNDGCSVMVAKASTVEQVCVALEHGFASGKEAMMIEEFVVGMELTCGVYGNNDVIALPPSRAVVAQGILSMAEKFLPGAGENQTPAPLPLAALQHVQSVVVAAYKAIGCKGYSRVDCFYQSADESPTGVERVVLLEFNTLPALTPATCLFHQAAEVGMRPMEFLDVIIQLGIAQHTKRHHRVDEQVTMNSTAV